MAEHIVTLTISKHKRLTIVSKMTSAILASLKKLKTNLGYQTKIFEKKMAKSFKSLERLPLAYV